MQIQCSTVKYSTVQYSTVQYSTVQYSTVQYSTEQCSTVQHSIVQYSTVPALDGGSDIPDVESEGGLASLLEKTPQFLLNTLQIPLLQGGFLL